MIYYSPVPRLPANPSTCLPPKKMRTLFVILSLALFLPTIAVAQKKKDKNKTPDFKVFWQNFQTQLKAQDKKKLADLCEFELYYIIRSKVVTKEDEKIEITRNKFMKEQFELLFNASARKEIARIKSEDVGTDMQDAQKRVAVVSCTNKAGKPARRRFFFEIDDNKYQLIMVDEEQL